MQSHTCTTSRSFSFRCEFADHFSPSLASRVYHSHAPCTENYSLPSLVWGVTIDVKMSRLGINMEPSLGLITRKHRLLGPVCIKSPHHKGTYHLHMKTMTHLNLPRLMHRKLLLHMMAYPGGPSNTSLLIYTIEIMLLGMPKTERYIF